MAKNVRNKLDKMFFKLKEQKVCLDNYAYVINPKDFEDFRQEVMIYFDFVAKAPVYNNLPIFVDDMIREGDIVLKRMEFIK